MDGKNLNQVQYNYNPQTGQPIYPNGQPVMQGQPVYPNGQPVMQGKPVYQQQPVQKVVNPDYINNYDSNKQKRTEMEIKVGAGVLSVIGAAFVLIALTYFGIYYLKDIFQIFAIFAGGALLVLLSELILERRIPKFAHVITGLGFGALYFAALFGYLSMEMYGFPIAIAIVTFVAIINFAFVRYRKSPVMEVVCSLGSIAPCIVYSGNVTEEHFLLLTVLMIILNIILTLHPFDKAFRASNIIRIVVISFTVSFVSWANKYTDVGYLYNSLFMISAIFSILLIYSFNTDSMGVKATALSFAGILSFAMYERDYYIGPLSPYVLGGMFLACLVCFFVMIKKKEKIAAISFFLLTMLWWFSDAKDPILAILVALCVLLISKLLLFAEEYAPVDIAVTVLALLITIFHDINPISYGVMAVALVGTILCSRYKLFHEFWFMLSSLAFICAIKIDYLTVPACLVILFVLVVIFNAIPTMKVNGIQAYNIFSAVFIGCCIMLVPILPAVGFEKIVILIACFIVGTLTCTVLLRPYFLMDTKSRYLILAIMLTYLAFFTDIGDLYKSVSLMAVAFILIAVGCFANRFEVRIYGLVLSLCVCVKVAFYDFKGESEFNRMVVFLIVGILAILISFVYLLLEKKEYKQKKMREAAQQQNSGTSALNPQMQYAGEQMPQGIGNYFEQSVNSPVMPVVQNNNVSTGDIVDNNANDESGETVANTQTDNFKKVSEVDNSCENQQ